MPTFPTDTPAVRAALLAYALPSAAPDGVEPEAWEQVGDALATAQGFASPVQQIVTTFDALSPHVASLDESGARLLAGCSHLIMTNAWHGKGGEASGVRDSAIARLVALGDG